MFPGIVLPACAGVILASCLFICFLQCFTRMRGGDPGLDCKSIVRELFYPHARG